MPSVIPCGVNKTIGDFYLKLTISIYIWLSHDWISLETLLLAKMRNFANLIISALSVSIALGQHMGFKKVNGSQYGLVDGVYGCNGTSKEPSKSRDRNNNKQSLLWPMIVWAGMMYLNYTICDTGKLSYFPDTDKALFLFFNAAQDVAYGIFDRQTKDKDAPGIWKVPAITLDQAQATTTSGGALSTFSSETASSTSDASGSTNQSLPDAEIRTQELSNN